MDAYDKFLVLSFVGETRVLGLNDDDELDEADIQGFSSSSQVRVSSLHAHPSVPPHSVMAPPHSTDLSHADALVREHGA
jgi:hypothetical protein